MRLLLDTHILLWTIGASARLDAGTRDPLEDPANEAPFSAASVAARVADLPPHHRDPFDRLLLAQAMAEPVRLHTADPKLQRYSELVQLIA